MRKRSYFFILIVAFIFPVILFSSSGRHNIIWKMIGRPVIDGEDEYEVRFVTYKITLLSMTKRDFEFVAKDALDKRRSSIKKYRLEQISDGVNPEYKLKIYQARSICDIQDALNEIEEWPGRKNERRSR